MVRSLLIRGMLAGLAAGLIAAVFARVFGEPQLAGGIAYEDAVAAAAGEHGGEPLVGRGVQSTIGLAVAYLVYGTAIGGIIALVHATARGRLGGLGERATAAVVTLVGFVAAVAVPFLKYPANPPAAGMDETIGLRTGAYLLMILISVGAAIGATVLARRLAAARGWWNAVLLAAGAYVVVVGVVGRLLPTVAETPSDFPADVLYNFRLASFLGQVVLWASVGLIFATLADRSARSGHARSLTGS